MANQGHEEGGMGEMLGGWSGSYGADDAKMRGLYFTIMFKRILGWCSAEAQIGELNILHTHVKIKPLFVWQTKNIFPIKDTSELTSSVDWKQCNGRTGVYEKINNNAELWSILAWIKRWKRELSTHRGMFWKICNLYVNLLYFYPSGLLSSQHPQSAPSCLHFPYFA